MKNRFVLFLFFCILSVGELSAQYANISVKKHPLQMEIIQIDFRESSTLVYVRYICPEGVTWMNIYEKTYIRLSGSTKKYPLINSINLPISMEALERNMLFDCVGQEHRFILEFEKLPETTEFDIIELENSEGAFNFYGITIDKTQVSEFMDMDDFINGYPVKELGRYVKDNQLISWVKADDIILTINIQAVKQYGKYYMVNMSLQNLSGKPILFNTNNIKAEGYIMYGDEIYESFPMEILTANEYDSKVSRRQTWNNFFVALGEGMAASSAGYSSTSTSYYGNSSTTSSAHAYGYIGNTYGYASAYGTSYTTSYGQAYASSYNGAAAYAAQQNARANTEHFAYSQHIIRQQLSDGYVKNNTIENGVEYTGYFNIKYKQIDHLTIEFVINGITFPFSF